ncbi:MAG: ABC transporter ATP-binding protein [Planctomycetota bacterium]|jgi:subfamily B ATP-binding cassette protein MsbA
MRTFGLPQDIGLTPEEREAAAARKRKRHEFHKKLWRRSLEIPKGEAHHGKLVGPAPDIMEGERHRGGSWSLLGRFLWFARPYVSILVAVFLLMIVAAGLQAALPVSFGYTIDKVLKQKDLQLLSIIAGALVALVLVRAVVNFVSRYLLHYGGQRLVNSIRRRIFGHLLAQPTAFIEEVQTGGTVARVINDVNNVSNLLFGSFADFASNCIRLMVFFTYLMVLNWRLTLVSCIFLPLFAMTFMRFRRKLRPAFRDIRNEMGGLSARVGEVFAGARVVKTNVQEHRENLSFLRKINLILRKQLNVQWIHVMLHISAETVSALGIVAMIWYSGVEHLSGRLSIGEIVTFYGLLRMMFQPMIQIVMINVRVQKALASMERVFEVLDSEPEPYGEPGKSEIRKVRGDVEFRNVTFHYEEGAPAALENVSFHVKPRETIAFVGPSGAGKTTIVNLLVRLYDPQEGAVFVDGRDIRDYPLSDYRDTTAMVLQDNFLFQGTIRANIAYGNPNATEEDVRRAAGMANALEFIERMENGFDTLVGERGAHISGGERQRIAIARAVLTDPRILIFDEATSSLDSCSEALIQEAMEDLLGERTTFVIAHRLSTVTNADRIYVIDQGCIQDSGTHEELLSRPGLYQKLFLEQYGRVKIGRDILASSAPATDDGPSGIERPEPVA